MPFQEVRVPLLCSIGAEPRRHMARTTERTSTMPGIDFRAVRSIVSMAEVLKLVGFVPSQSCGEQWRGPCPIHRSEHPRSRTFSVHLARNAYQCFHCGSSGNQLDLWAALTQTDLHAATIDLCERLHLEIPWIRQW